MLDKDKKLQESSYEQLLEDNENHSTVLVEPIVDIKIEEDKINHAVYKTWVP